MVALRLKQTPLNPARMTAIDLIGLDYYHKASPGEHWSILRRTTELAMRCEGRDRPACRLVEARARGPRDVRTLAEPDEHDARPGGIGALEERDQRVGPAVTAGPVPRRARRVREAEAFDTQS